MELLAYTEQIEAVRQIARNAGDAIMDIYSQDFDIEFKDDRSPLTAADKAAHRIIVAGLQALEPALPILSEESDPDTFELRRAWQRFWLVDPLDGTKEFIRRNGEFTVNIALIEAHRAVMGVVFAPAIDTMYSGINGTGAWLQTNGNAQTPISVRTPSANPVRVVGSRSHASPALAEYLEQIGPHEIQPMGSSLKICLVAAGEADVYPRHGPTSEWDTAAAHAVLEAAGGSMMDMNGNPLLYNARNELLNPYFIAYGDSSRNWIPKPRER